MANAIPTIDLEAGEDTFEASGEVLDRRAVLRILSQAIEETGARVSGPRFRPREGDREKLAYLRTLTALASAYSTVLAGAKETRLDGLPDVPTAEDLAHEREVEAKRKAFARMLDDTMY